MATTASSTSSSTPQTSAAASTATVTINGKSYRVADLSEAARIQVLNIQAVDGEINRLKLQMAIARTARKTYLDALQAALPAADAPAA